MSITAAITNGRSCNTYIRHHQFALCACLDHHQLSMVSFNVQCSASGGKRGFGRQSVKKEKTNKSMAPKEQKSSASQPRKSTAKQFDTVFGQEPGVNTRLDAKYNNIASDLQFEERLEAVRRSAIEQKKEAESKQYGAIDYDSPVESDKKTIGFGTKVGVGVAVAVFGLVFALGDFLPTGSVSPVEDATVVNNKLTDEEKVTLQTRLQQYEATLNIYPKDQTALEGAAVTLAELGDYSRAASLLENLIKERPNDPDAYRLLGEVKYELKDYEGSAAAYKSSASMSKTVDFEVLRGLTNAFLASQKPDEAVQVLLAFRERLSIEDSNSHTIQNDASSNVDKEIQKVDPIQVELLLGKAYSDWGHVSDAVSVYDRLISTYPNDFRGYLAKGIILKENGSIGDAERMFIQARFFAPEKAKVLVDRYSRQ